MNRIRSLLLALIIGLAGPRCFTYATALAVSPSSKHVRLNKQLTYTGAEISESGWVRLMFQGLESDGLYQRCIAPEGDGLEYCPVDFAAVAPATDPLANKPNGLFYLKYGVAFFSERVTRSVYFPYHEQFGAPTSVWISADGSRLHVEYWNHLMHKVTCYSRTLDYEKGDTDFVNDCFPGRPPSGFVRMERMEIKDAVLVELFPPSVIRPDSAHEIVWVARPGKMQHIQVWDIWGQEPESGYPVLYLLFPVTIALDIVTFPLQYFLWRPPSPLG